MTSKTITIQGLHFDASLPYAAGHVITEAEAKTLNQTRLENLRNNFASTIKSVLGEASEPTEEQLADLRSKFAAYDAEYVFTMTSAGGGKRETDPVQAEANRLAKAALTARIKSQGKNVKDIDPSTLAAAIERVASSEAIQKQAKKNVAERSKAAEMDLADLGL